MVYLNQISKRRKKSVTVQKVCIMKIYVKIAQYLMWKYRIYALLTHIFKNM